MCSSIRSTVAWLRVRCRAPDAVPALPPLGSDHNPSHLWFLQATETHFCSVMIKLGRWGGQVGHDTTGDRQDTDT